MATARGSSGTDTGETAGHADTDVTTDTADDTEASTGPGGSPTDASSDDTEASTGPPDCAPRPSAMAPWITEYQTEIVAALTGPTLGVRASATARAATADYLAAALSGLGLIVAEHAYASDGRNVYATVPATNGSEALIVVGAHFDTVPGSPGANDNATGVALVLSAARYLREIECRNIGVMVVLLDQEEIGLVGSDNFASFLAREGHDVVAVHTVDQIGWDSDGDRGVELERADEGLFEAYEAAVRALPIAIPLTPTTTGATDHVSFRAHGFAAVGVTEQFVSGDTTPHYHAPSDTLQTVDFAYLASSTALVHEVLGQHVWP